MASQLYKMLTNIEDGRQDIRKELKLKGIETEENASLQDLASNIGMLTINNPASEEDMETWIRPSEWPDTKTILAEAEKIFDKSPSIILLLNNKYDTFNIPTQNYNNLGLNAGYYKMSDGTIYTDQISHTHTWDTSKDIDGKYRYVLCYYQSTPSKLSLPGRGLIEAVIGKFPGSPSSSPLILSSSSYQQYCDLINFEILSTSNFIQLSHTAMSQAAFCYLPNLEHINLGSVTGLNTYTNSIFFQYLPNLQVFEAPNFSGSISLLGMPKLKTFYAPKLNGILSVSNLMSTFNLRRIVTGKVNLSGYNFAFIPVNDNMSFPTDANIYPLNAHKIKITSSFRWESNYGQQINLASPFLTTVDFSECIPSTLNWYPNSCFTIGTCAPRLKHIIWPTKICGNISLEFTDLDIESLTSLFTVLPDATDVELTYTPYVRLGRKNLAKLSAEDIKVATDKGWEVK